MYREKNCIVINYEYKYSNDRKVFIVMVQSKKYTIILTFLILFFLSSLSYGDGIINSFKVNCRKILEKGDVLEVQMLGEPYQKAYFDIGEWKKGLPLHESFRTPGLYIGSYTVQKGDYVLNAPVTGYIISSSGETVKSISNRLISIVASELLLKITQPGEGDFVANQFVVSGQTRPFTTVHIEVKITCNLPGIGPVDSGVISEDIKVNRGGVFEYKVKTGNQLPGSEYTVTVMARDAQGNKSTPGIVKVFQK
mgnify:CR=1 FL=1